MTYKDDDDGGGGWMDGCLKGIVYRNKSDGMAQWLNSWPYKPGSLVQIPLEVKMFPLTVIFRVISVN